LFIEVRLPIHSLFALAKGLVARHRHRKELRRAERHLLEAIAFHKFHMQFGYYAEVHEIYFTARLGQLARVRDEQEMACTGKNFWRLHDLDKYALFMRGFEKRGTARDLCEEWSRIPASAIPALYRRMNQMRHAEKQPRDRSHLLVHRALNRPALAL
jgi:hypothetical protein